MRNYTLHEIPMGSTITCDVIKCKIYACNKSLKIPPIEVTTKGHCDKKIKDILIIAGIKKGRLCYNDTF